MLADIEWQGRPRKVMLWANRNGVMYVLDRATGEFLKGKPYVKTNWLDGFDAKGRPNRVKFPTPEGTLIHPHVHGGTNWAPPSFSPRTGLFYVATLGELGHARRRGPVPARRQPNTRQTAMGADEPGAVLQQRHRALRRGARLRPEDARPEVGIQA